MKRILRIGGSLPGKLLIIMMLILPLLLLNTSAAFAKTSAASVKTAVTSNDASTCYNYPSEANCDGMDPQAAGCGADAYTQTWRPVNAINGQYYGTLELRYSPHCGANWARYTAPAGERFMINYLVVERCSIPASSDGACNGPIDIIESFPIESVTSLIWTVMVYAPVKGARAYIVAGGETLYTPYI